MAGGHVISTVHTCRNGYSKDGVSMNQTVDQKGVRHKVFKNADISDLIVS